MDITYNMHIILKCYKIILVDNLSWECAIIYLAVSISLLYVWMFCVYVYGYTTWRPDVQRIQKRALELWEIESHIKQLTKPRTSTKAAITYKLWASHLVLKWQVLIKEIRNDGSLVNSIRALYEYTILFQLLQVYQYIMQHNTHIY